MSFTPLCLAANLEGLAVLANPGLAAGFVGGSLVLGLGGLFLGRRARFAVSARRLRFIFEHSPVAMVVTDMREHARWVEAGRRASAVDLDAWSSARPDAAVTRFESLRLVAANRAALEMAGARDLEDLRARLPGFAADFTGVFRDKLLALWEGRHELAREIVVHSPGGQPRHAMLHWSVPLEKGKPDHSRVMSVYTDITDLRRTQDRLRRSEDRWSLAVRGINAGIWEIDFTDGTYFISARSQEMLGYVAGDVEETREAWDALVHPDDRAATTEALRRHLTGERAVYRIEHRLLCKDGLYRWILSRGLARFDEGRRPARIVGTHSDIHARKTAEAGLAAERERLRVTLGAMAEGVLSTDRRGVVTYLNPAAEQLTGWTDGAALGRPLEEVCPLREERSGAPLEPPYRKVLAGQAKVAVELTGLIALVHRQGVPRRVEGRCAPLLDISGRPEGCVLVLRDVAERARHEAEMLRASKLESLGVLAGGIAHDFNNLLTVIMGNVTLARLDTQARPAGAQWLEEAERGLLRARDLTQQLLTFAKGGDPVRSAVQLAEVARESARFSLHGARARCQFDIPADIWAVEADKGQIGQVVQNLVLNASQAMPEGGVIWLALANDPAPPPRTGLTGPSVRIGITDTGGGIRPEHLSRVFDPYFTTKHEGSGLGLATVYAIVRKHGGYIEVDSEVGVGTKFRIWLPAVRTVAAEPVAKPTFDAGANLSGRVLLMDDEEPIRMMASELLRRLGFVVEAVADGAKAVTAFRQAQEAGRPFDLVVTDLTVPGGMGGLACLRELRRLEPKVRVIVSSGYSSDPVMSDHRAYGFAGVIPKPYRITDFAKVIRRVVEGLE